MLSSYRIRYLKRLTIAVLSFSVLMGQIDGKIVVKEEYLSPDEKDFDCHSSSLIETTKGHFCAVWKGGRGSGKSNIDMSENVGVWISLFDGRDWSSPKELIESPHSIAWSPVLAKNMIGELILFYRMGVSPRCCVSLYSKSQDGGTSWTESQIMSAGIVGPTKTKPVLGRSGTLISPSSNEMGEPKDPLKATACWIELSSDGGETWKRVGPLEIPGRKFGAIEPTLFFDKEGKLRMMCRDRAHKIGEIGTIWTAVSEDGGLSWSTLKSTGIPNPDSSIDVVDLGQGRLVLLYNHSYTDRYPFNAAVSVDGGDSWSHPIVLDEVGEFPSGVISSDGLVHVTYAHSGKNEDQRRIKHIAIDPNELFKVATFD